MSLLLTIDWTASPEIFQIGKFAFRWYPLMFVISFVAGLNMVKKMYTREGKNIDELDWLLMAVLLGTIFGARIGHYVFYDPQLIFTNPIEVFLPIEFTDNGIKFTGYRGLASHGAVFGILIALYLYTRKFKHHFMWVVDRVVIPTAFAAIFIRLGNFFNHEIIGKPMSTKFPWATDFSLAAEDYNAQGINEVIYRHPTQIYESLCYLITFATLFIIYKKLGKKTPYGLLFGVFMIMIWGARFFIEFFKESQNANDDGILSTFGLNIGQLLSVPMVLVGLFFLLYYVPKIGKKAVANI